MNTPTITDQDLMTAMWESKRGWMERAGIDTEGMPYDHALMYHLLPYARAVLALAESRHAAQVDKLQKARDGQTRMNVTLVMENAGLLRRIAELEAQAAQPAQVAAPTQPDAEHDGVVNVRLLELADRIDHEHLWRLSGVAQRDLPQDKRDRMDAGVQLRRYANFFGQDCWRIFPPKPGISFRAKTLEGAYEMASQDAARSEAAQPAKVAAPDDYLGGVNLARLQSALTNLGCAKVGQEETAARLGEFVNRLTDAVLRNMDALRSAQVAAPARIGGWQLIETAPKDGTAILVAEGYHIYCVEWSEELDWWAVDDNKLGPFRLRGPAPTHWMPLPAAPKREGGA
jgi:hypothetical protein